MRKYIRQLMRYEAIKEKSKPSKYIKDMFMQLQVKKYGTKTVAKNKAKGTHKKNLWPTRLINAAQ